jgi:hypothetical protein
MVDKRLAHWLPCCLRHCPGSAGRRHRLSGLRTARRRTADSLRPGRPADSSHCPQPRSGARRAIPSWSGRLAGDPEALASISLRCIRMQSNRPGTSSRHAVFSFAGREKVAIWFRPPISTRCFPIARNAEAVDRRVGTAHQNCRSARFQAWRRNGSRAHLLFFGETQMR